jgi:WD40 repeat protein
MARICRHCAAIAAACALLAGVSLAPASAQDQGPNASTDLYDRPVLAIDPGMHTSTIWAQAVDAKGQYAVTGGADRTARIWSIADGKLVKTIWIPVGPDPVGQIFAVAISPDGSTIAVGGLTENGQGPCPIYLFDRESGTLIKRIHGALPDVTRFLTFSPDGRYLAATLISGGIRVFDRNKDWSEAFRDDSYGGRSYGASFSPDGQLATTSFDGMIRLYRYDRDAVGPNFRRVGEPVKTPSGHYPWRIAFSPDGKRLAVGYYDVAAVDILDGATLKRLGGQAPAGVFHPVAGLSIVEWSRDGRTLFAAGGVIDGRGRALLFAWDRPGLGNERRMTYCAPNTATDVSALPDGQILVASLVGCLGLMDAQGDPLWTSPSPVLDFGDQTDIMKVSADGKTVDFGYSDSADAVLRFDLRSLALSSSPPSDGSTSLPNREGLAIDGWRAGTQPTLGKHLLTLLPYEYSESLAIASDAKRFFLGTSFGLVAFDDAGSEKWRRLTQGVVWSVNASGDGRTVVAAEVDGTIRWYRADDGHELLALQLLPNRSDLAERDPTKSDWVLWTPEGFYEATPGAQDVLKWVTNHGPDKEPTTLPVSAIAKLHRPNALPHVLDQLETAHALGVDDISQARLDVKTATGSAKPPGGILHVVAIGLDKFGDKAGGLHLNYAAEDAHDVANGLVESQKIGPGKASLYADVTVQYLPNEEASKTAILDALDATEEAMRKSGQDQDVAVILVSSHGEMIDRQFYLVPYDFAANGSQNAATSTAVSASEFAKKVESIAKHGKVLLLLDACHSGAVGPGGWATDPDTKVLQDAMDMENVTVLTSSKKNELSEELPEWRHGALTQAFLDALIGAADSQGIISLSALADAMEAEVQSLTKGKQHLGRHQNFGGDFFVAAHY